MNRLSTVVVVLGAVMAGAMARRWGGGGHHGGRRPGGHRPGGAFDGDYEKAFFCQVAHKACYLVLDADGTELVNRTCPGDLSCEDGTSGSVSLRDVNYTITFCPRPNQGEEIDPLEILVSKGEKPAPSDALVAICEPNGAPKPPKSKTPLWYKVACKVTEGDAELKPERSCRGTVECTKGPYEAEYEGKTVQATFCNYERPSKPEGEGEQDKEPFWYRAACSVETTDGAVLEQDDCPRDRPCTTRLFDIDYDGTSVNAGFCDGVKHHKGKGRPGGKGRREGKGRSEGNGRPEGKGRPEGTGSQGERPGNGRGSSRRGSRN